MLTPTVDEEEEHCPVCQGSGVLLKDRCPLCGDDSSTCASVGDGCEHKPPEPIGRDARKFSAVDAAQWIPTTPLTPKSPLCLVLDIDGTLLSESENVGVASMASLLRPNLVEFLDFAFVSFSGVAIWTAASQEWLDAFLHAVDPKRMRTWAFAWSFSRISWLRLEAAASDGPSEPVLQHVKRLSKIWKNKALRSRGFLPHTTLIVDNNPSCCLANYGNAIYIKTYSGTEDPTVVECADGDDHNRGDDWLLVLMEYLRILHENQVPGQTVRHVDKRGWYEQTKAAGIRQRAHTA